VTQGRTDQPNPNPQRVTARDAAVALGISEGAVRMRIKRGTLASTREHGRLYVLLDAAPHTEPTRSDTDRLISTLEEQLRLEREAHAEARRLLAAALERIPAVEAPPDERGSPPTPSEPVPGSRTSPEQQAATERPWYRRIFGSRS